MHLSAILFDLDGTLIDSYRDIGIHLNRTLRDFNLPQVDIESVRHMVGGGARELLKRFFSNGLLEEALAVFRDYYMKEPVIYTKPFEGIEEALSRAMDKNISLAVVTNKMEALSKLILKELGLLDYFSLVVGGDTLSEKKPSPLPVLYTLQSLGVSPAQALMVGDTEADMTAGRLAGVKRGLARWGYVKLEKEVPDFELEKPTDLLKRFI
ncbi:MAG: HAD-IA family hydrolase [Aquificaceae bacterium]|jgi:phosphoglycolate phosphatase|uniref:HAD family hydrolase n=1 Tax=Hydrogenobacter sp. Uz 6-8 TaxID=3384828 RepID=UPI00309E42AA